MNRKPLSSPDIKDKYNNQYNIVLLSFTESNLTGVKNSLNKKERG